MPKRILIAIGRTTIFAGLKETPTAEKLWEALPFKAKAETWGGEVYFRIPVSAALEADARQVVSPGAVCFWTQGSCLALPYGPTPIAEGKECRLADPCNILGQVEGDPTALRHVRSGDPVRVEAVKD
jgi:uncharacterized protein